MILRTQDLTYAELGKRIGLSESGVKKILTARDISLSRLAQICEASSTSLADLTQDDPEPKAPELELDEETQDFFLKNRSCFHLFFLILTEPKSFEEIIEEYQISKKLGLKYLRELDKRKLVKWMPNDRVIPNINKSTLFKYSGPFIKQLVAEWSHALVDEVLDKAPGKTVENFFAIRLFYFLPETEKEFLESLSQLILEFGMKSVREKKYYGKLTKPSRILTVLSKGHFVKGQGLAHK